MKMFYNLGARKFWKHCHFHYCFPFSRYYTLNPLYNGKLYHCYILDKSICHFRGCQVNFVAFILFLMENPVSK